MLSVLLIIQLSVQLTSFPLLTPTGGGIHQMPWSLPAKLPCKQSALSFYCFTSVKSVIFALDLFFCHSLVTIQLCKRITLENKVIEVTLYFCALMYIQERMNNCLINDLNKTK